MGGSDLSEKVDQFYLTFYNDYLIVGAGLYGYWVLIGIWIWIR